MASIAQDMESVMKDGPDSDPWPTFACVNRDQRTVTWNTHTPATHRDHAMCCCQQTADSAVFASFTSINTFTLTSTYIHHLFTIRITLAITLTHLVTLTHLSTLTVTASNPPFNLNTLYLSYPQKVLSASLWRRTVVVYTMGLAPFQPH